MIIYKIIFQDRQEADLSWIWHTGLIVFKAVRIITRQT